MSHARSETMDRRFRRAAALQRRECDLDHARRKEAVVVDLPEPIRAGWERYFAVRRDLRGSAEGPMLARVLRLVNRVEYSGRRDFAERDRHRGGRMVPRPHKLGTVAPHVYTVMTPEMKRYFVLDVERKDNGRLGEVRFAVLHPWKFESRIAPSFITQRVIPNGDAESEIADIRAELYGPVFLWRHMLHHCGGGNHHDMKEVRARDRRQAPAPDNDDEEVMR